MLMKRVRLTLVLALLALSAFSWPALAGDPDTPQVNVIKRLAPAPGSDGGHGHAPVWREIWWIGRAWVSVYFGRWSAR